MKVKIKKSFKQTLDAASNKVYMLGTALPVLGTEEEVYFKGKDIQILVRPLSDEPACYNVLDNSKLMLAKDPEPELRYHVFGKHVFSISRILGKQGEVTEKSSQRINDLLNDNFILFSPTINIQKGSIINNGDATITCEIYRNVVGDIVTIPKNEFSDEDEYIRIPRINKSIYELKQAFQNKESIELAGHPAGLYPPDYLICENYLVQLKYGSIESVTAEGCSWSLNEDVEDVYVYKLEDESRLLKATDHLYFINEYDVGGYEFLTKLSDIVEDNADKQKNTKVKKQAKDKVVSLNNIEKNDEEIIFLKKLRENCLKQGLLYTEKDLINLHTSIKTNELTIISGRTGTGKSQLAVQYSELLCGEKHLMIPVEVSFQEADDLLGYLNVTTGVYHSAKTKLVDFLLEAQNDCVNMYTVIFDEMNLAQVEHWFAPFISILEQSNKKLRLYNGYCINSEKYPAELTIGDNVRFIGTINLDETVKDFSDRLLDRANQIELTKKRFSDILNIKNEKNDKKLYVKNICMIDMFKKTKKSNSNIILEDNVIQFLDDLDAFLSEQDHKKGISYRVVQKISSYLNSIPNSKEEPWKLSKAEALDLQIAQRVISKVKGTSRTLNGLLVSDEEYTSSPLYCFFEQETLKEISEFEVTKNLLKRKIKELCSYGYTY